MSLIKSILVTSFVILCAFSAQAEKPTIAITIKDHLFSPTEIAVPAGQKIKLVIHNQDSTPEEFESHDLNREKIINGKGKATVFVGPLEPGRYHFFGEFHKETANGYLIVK
jgi:plastocyanin